MHHWWIRKDSLLAGSNPSTSEMIELHEQFGVVAIVSLLEEPDERPRYDPDVIARLGIERLVVPVADGTAPSLDQIERFLQFVERHGARGMTFVHCMGGAGRTGTMGATVWIAQGLSATDAIRRIRTACPFAIETGSQEKALAELEAGLKGTK